MWFHHKPNKKAPFHLTRKLLVKAYYDVYLHDLQDIFDELHGSPISMYPV